MPCFSLGFVFYDLTEASGRSSQLCLGAFEEKVSFLCVVVCRCRLIFLLFKKNLYFDVSVCESHKLAEWHRGNEGQKYPNGSNVAWTGLLQELEFIMSALI